MGMRFPANVRDEASMWETLIERKCNISAIPDNRWSTWELWHPKRNEPGRSVAFAAGILEDIDQFDASFFNISPREAAWMDPQQRLLLEMAHEAMEDAGIPDNSLRGTSCGVYVGISGMDYGQNALSDLACMSAHTMTGNTLSIAANRISYFFDLRGPSIAIDTACSSGLAAVHHACQALRNGEIPIALAGGINLLLHPYSFIGFSHASMISSKGHCRPFDAAADGYVRGEGGALLLLKPLNAALEDGDHIHALILGSGVNSDGARKNGLTIPSVDAQTELMMRVLDASGLKAADIDFVEAHGTGTPVGDPVEAKSIGKAYGRGRITPLPISSAKANFGHLEPASGLVSMIKAIVTLKHGFLPPMPLDFTPNPAINFKELNIVCAANGQELPFNPQKPATGAVNSFGFGGLNAHVLLRAWPAAPAGQDTGKFQTSDSPAPLFLSARNENALRSLAASYAGLMEKIQDGQFYDLAWNAACRRNFMEKRLCVWAASKDQYIAGLKDYASGNSGQNITCENVAFKNTGPAFIYSGNGAQWHGMGRQLHGESHFFAETLSFLDRKMLPVLGWSVEKELLEGSAETLLDTARSQPLLFAIQVCLTLFLNNSGIYPAATAGHSVGEVAAAWAGGALSLDEAVAIIHARSVAQGKTHGCGKMAAAGIGAEEALARIDSLGLGGQLEIAAINSPRNCTISGDAKALEILGQELEKQRLFFRLLNLEYAFHSKRMEKARSTLENMLGNFKPTAQNGSNFVSTVTGRGIIPGELDFSYWWNNIRQPVNFQAAIRYIADSGINVFAEIGPHAILQRYMRESLRSKNIKILPSLQQSSAGIDRMRQTAASLHLLNPEAGLKKLFPRKGQWMPLPHYPWQNQSCWYCHTNEATPGIHREMPVLGWRLPGPDPVWELVVDPRKDTWLADHKIGGAIVFPAAGYVEMALEAARKWLGKTSVSLEDFDISLPMVLDGGKGQTIRCSIHEHDGTLAIMSRPRLDNSRWTTHAKCRVVVSGQAQEQVPDFIGRHINGEDLYDLAFALGLEYGKFFQRILETHHNDESVASILRPARHKGYVLDPGALDAGFHSLIALYARETGDSAFLPVGFSRLTVHTAAAPRKIRADITKKGNRTLHADIFLADENNNLVAKVENCLFRKLPLSNDRRGFFLWKTEAISQPLEIIPESASFPHLKTLAENAVEQIKLPHGERRRWYHEILPALEASVLARFCDLEARYGDTLGECVPAPFFAWMRSLAKNENIFGDAAQPDPQIPDWHDIWRDAYLRSPDCLPALLPVGRILQKLPDVVEGSISAAGLLKTIENDAIAAFSSAANPAYTGVEEILRNALVEALKNWNAERAPRILEVSGYSQSLSNFLKTVLPQDNYSLTTVCAEPHTETVSAESQNGSITHNVPHCGEWMLEHAAQNENVFDIIVIRQYAHKVENLLRILRSVHHMLVSGGIVLLAERYGDWSADLISGLTEDWWHSTSDGKIISSRLPASAWKSLLQENGFEECELVTEPAADNLEEGAFLLLARKPAVEYGHEIHEVPSQSWLFFHDDASLDLAASIVDGLCSNGQAASLCDVKKCVVSENLDKKYDNNVFICGYEDEPASAAALLAEINELTARSPRTEPPARNWFITRGGALLSRMPAGYGARPVQAAIAGFARVLKNEKPHLTPIVVDIDPRMKKDAVLEALLKEFLYTDGADEILLEEKGRKIPKVLAAEKDENITGDYFRLDVTQPGRLDNLLWTRAAQADLPPDCVEAKVMATGLNFRDVMLAMGLLPEDAIDNGFAGPTFGLEFSGIITRVGPAVRNFTPGDRVAGFAPACFSSHVVTPASAVAAIPAEINFLAAASFPTIFITAWYALKHLACIQAGEWVLIHGGAGGVGIAALQIAKLYGAVVCATAGTPEKRQFLELLGADYIFDSRSLDFADEIMAITNGKGVDIVLNSLAGEAMRRSIGLLKPFGRFLELGKRDYVENTSVSLRPFKENISYFSIDVDQLLTAKPELATRLFDEIVENMKDGKLFAPPYRAFPKEQVKDAFRTMQQARHIGKIVVDMSRQECPKRAPAEESLLDVSGTWLISGGTSGFGLATARHLARLGVKHIVLASRRGHHIPGASKIYTEFAALDTDVTIVACDFSDMEAVRVLMAFITEELPPLKGIVHAAAVFDDRRIENLDREAFGKSLSPKLAGAWNLHKATENLSINHFILYSSISVVLGNPGQANYVAANAGLEALARHRLEKGLPASCIAWGPISDTGYLARNATVKKSLASQLGGDPFTTKEAMREFTRLAPCNGVHTVARIDWGSALRFMETMPGRLEALCSESKAAANNESPDTFLEIIRNMESGEALEKLRLCVAAEAARVLGLDSSKIVHDQNLQSMGLDSLMAMELALSLEQATGLRLPPMLLQDSPTIEQLAKRLLERITGNAGDDDSNAVMLAQLARRHSENFDEDEAKNMLSDVEAKDK